MLRDWSASSAWACWRANDSRCATASSSSAERLTNCCSSTRICSRSCVAWACISPTVAAKALGSEGLELTIGNDADVAAGIEQLGAKHHEHPVNEIHIDAVHKIVSTPAYMYDASIAEVAIGIRKMVEKVIEMTG